MAISAGGCGSVLFAKGAARFAFPPSKVGLSRTRFALVSSTLPLGC